MRKCGKGGMTSGHRGHEQLSSHLTELSGVYVEDCGPDSKQTPAKASQQKFTLHTDVAWSTPHGCPINAIGNTSHTSRKSIRLSANMYIYDAGTECPRGSHLGQSFSMKGLAGEAACHQKSTCRLGAGTSNICHMMIDKHCAQILFNTWPPPSQPDGQPSIESAATYKSS